MTTRESFLFILFIVHCSFYHLSGKSSLHYSRPFSKGSKSIKYVLTDGQKLNAPVGYIEISQDKLDKALDKLPK